MTGASAVEVVSAVCRRRRSLPPGSAAKPAKLAVEPRLRTVAEAKLALRWSPAQIAGWLPPAYPQDPVLRVSHQTIYRSLFVQSRGALRREIPALSAHGAGDALPAR